MTNPVHRRRRTVPACAALLIAGASQPAAGQAPVAPIASVASCAQDPQFHALDFALGAWKVTTPEGSVRSQVTMLAALSGCTILESWDRPAGQNGNGKGMLTYSRDLGKWTYSWSSDKGAALFYTGELVAPGKMLFTIELPSDSPGRKKIRHWTLAVKPDGGLRELSMITQDEGKSWTQEYDLQWTHIVP